MTVLYNDYETIPIGGGNPYHKCKHCFCSVPYINGDLRKHHTNCEYRVKKEREIAIAKMKGRKITRTEILNLMKLVCHPDSDGIYILDDEDIEKFANFLLEAERKL